MRVRADHRRGDVMTDFAEARKWYRVIRASVREACETWRIQAQPGPVTSEALEAIVNRAVVPILALLERMPPDAVAALVPRVLRVMPAAVVEVVAEEQGKTSHGR